MRRIEKYLGAQEVAPVPPIDQQSQTIAFQSATVTWPQDRAQASVPSSAASTPRHKFLLTDLTLKFPQGELSLICGKLGSGKTLLLLGACSAACSVNLKANQPDHFVALLGEADLLTGQMICPRSPPNALASFIKMSPKEDWVVQGICAYVPQVCRTSFATRTPLDLRLRSGCMAP